MSIFIPYRSAFNMCAALYAFFFYLVYALQIRGSCNIRLAMETVASKHFAHSPASELWATLGKQPTVFSFPSKHNTGVFQNIFFSAKRPTDYGGGRRHTILQYIVRYSYHGYRVYEHFKRYVNFVHAIFNSCICAAFNATTMTMFAGLKNKFREYILVNGMANNIFLNWCK